MKSFYISFHILHSLHAALTSFAPHSARSSVFTRSTLRSRGSLRIPLVHLCCICAASVHHHRSICRATNICIVSCCLRNNSSISPFWRNNSMTVVLSSIGGGGGIGNGVSFSIHPPICVIYRASCLYTLSQYSHLYSGSFDNSTQIK